MSFREQIRGASTIMTSVWQEQSNRDQRLRRIFMAAGWQGWKRIVRKPLELELFNGMRFRAYPDCACSSSAVYSKIPNSRYVRFLRNHAERGTFLDVGANVGMISTLLADTVQHALLFEPNPVAAARARENIKINQLSFEVYEIALSDETGTIAFEDLGGVHTCNRTVSGFSTNSRTITVPRTTFDRFLAERGPLENPVTLVKIDVEGHENWVLRGMRQLLVEQRPIVMFEYLQRTNLKETFATFAGVDYRIMILSREGELTLAPVNPPPLQDLLAVPSERARALTRSSAAA
jgi:FkbM family methyltransferase